MRIIFYIFILILSISFLCDIINNKDTIEEFGKNWAKECPERRQKINFCRKHKNNESECNRSYTRVSDSSWRTCVYHPSGRYAKQCRDGPMCGAQDAFADTQRRRDEEEAQRRREARRLYLAQQAEQQRLREQEEARLQREQDEARRQRELAAQLLAQKLAANAAMEKANLEMERQNALLEQQLAKARDTSNIDAVNREKQIAEDERRKLEELLAQLQAKWASEEKASNSANLTMSESIKMAEAESDELRLKINGFIQKFENERRLREALRLDLKEAYALRKKIQDEHSAALAQQEAEHARKQEELRKRLNALAEKERLEAERLKQEKQKVEAEARRRKLENELAMQQKEYEAEIAEEKRKLEIAEAQRLALIEAEKLARSTAEREALKVANKDASEQIELLKKELEKRIEEATQQKIKMQLEIDGLNTKIKNILAKIKETRIKLAWTENQLSTCSIYTRRMQTMNPYLI